MLATIRANLLACILGLAAAIFLVIAVVQTVRIDGFGIWPLRIPGLKAKYETAIHKLADARDELKRISTAKDEQGKTTAGTVKLAEKGEREARPIADRIRTAPIMPGKCETPGLDLLRNEI